MIPGEVITDNVTEFTSSEFHALINRYDTKHKRTKPRYSQTGGKVERLNHELIQCLEWITADDGKKRKDWDLYIRRALLAFRAPVNQRLVKSPFSLPERR